ncbi:hypothetical protein C4K05_3965 [Pseudomonas chlororaphis subsp. aureofaciens]|nr:hypothetical protein C4K13_4068 [Pseudomonas chlororaphis subsp. aureofaciens]AZD99783.1 hypothetical protein C4K12_3920 [Pseudomonas chlororaphis subsp. aureofaciens]AZE24386.1 hypothetical protein C4K08_3962 [Pseudomonas chlororaphis subsp. aureofaciens]AZE43302.1 hypothetical protein C4K05_3965 [Pseudomonas chlororaphis subsp. aureofaciens]
MIEILYQIKNRNKSMDYLFKVACFWMLFCLIDPIDQPVVNSD